MQEEHATGQTGEENVMCIHGYPDGEGCYLCDPDHPFRRKEGAKA